MNSAVFGDVPCPTVLNSYAKKFFTMQISSMAKLGFLLSL